MIILSLNMIKHIIKNNNNLNNTQMTYIGLGDLNPSPLTHLNTLNHLSKYFSSHSNPH